MVEHRELIERLEKLDGPSREVDALLARSLAEQDAADHWFLFCGRWVTDEICPALTASLDAAVALVGRLLPGWGYYLRSDKEGNGCGLVYPDAFRVTPCHCMGATPAIAMVLALLKALEAHS